MVYVLYFSMYPRLLSAGETEATVQTKAVRTSWSLTQADNQTLPLPYQTHTPHTSHFQAFSTTSEKNEPTTPQLDQLLAPLLGDEVQPEGFSGETWEEMKEAEVSFLAQRWHCSFST